MATAFTQTMLSAMSQAINKLNSDIADGASGSTLIADVVAYYNLQTSVRGYASEAAEVAANINYNGNVANQNVENYVNSVGGNWAATQVTLATSLAIADWNTINANQGMIPTLYYLDQEHINVFSAIPIAGTNLTGIPITYWSGTPFAYENQNWLGTVATSSELSGASQASLFSQESTSQIAASFFQLLYAVGQAEVNFDDVQDWTSLQEAMADQVVAVNFLNYVAANDPALASALLGGAVTMGKNGLSGFIKISETQLQQTLYPQQSAQLVPISLTLNEDSSGNFQSLTTDNNGGTSTVTTYLANGLLSSAPFAVQDDYSSADGTGSLVQTYIDFSSGGSEVVAPDLPIDLPGLTLSGGASAAGTYTVGSAGATLAQVAAELGMPASLLDALNPSLGATATLAFGTAVTLYSQTGWAQSSATLNTQAANGTDLTRFSGSAAAGPSFVYDLANSRELVSASGPNGDTMYIEDEGTLVGVLPAGWLASATTPQGLPGPVTFTGTNGQSVTYAPGASGGQEIVNGNTVSGAVTVDPSATGSGVTVSDSAGSGTITFDDAASGTGDPDFWTVGSGTDTATLQAGTAVVDFTGGQSQYAVSYTASSQTLAVTDGVAGRNGAKTLTAAGGTASLFFAQGTSSASEVVLANAQVTGLLSAMAQYSAANNNVCKHTATAA